MNLTNYQEDMIDFYILKEKLYWSVDREESFQLRKQLVLFIENHLAFIEDVVLKMFSHNKNSLCIMSMVGGPYYTGRSSLLEIRHPMGGKLQVVIDNQWAGYIDLLDNVCGMDNLKYLINFIFENNNMESAA